MFNPVPRAVCLMSLANARLARFALEEASNGRKSLDDVGLWLACSGSERAKEIELSDQIYCCSRSFGEPLWILVDDSHNIGPAGSPDSLQLASGTCVD